MLFGLSKHCRPPRRIEDLVAQALKRGEQVAGPHVQRAGQLPDRPERDGAAALDPLVVPQAESPRHHVLLCQAAAHTKPTYPVPKDLAEMVEIVRPHGDGR